MERLGSGGYGEVWKATAPGGLLKAVKFVYGDMGEARAGQEIKALHRIKGVRHPFLLSIERVENVDGQLVIVTELADESLIETFEARRLRGEVGLPRDELLGYMRDVADALDYMTATYGLQHLDVKPGNLLLVGGRVKVADFGLVKEIRGDNATASGGVSPAYAAAEFFDGRVSRYSDQYSLAIVYQELLTGVRPFPGATPVQLALQHTTGAPMLDPLPAHDRPIVARALAKDPNERFSSCNEFVRALVEAPRGPRAREAQAETEGEASGVETSAALAVADGEHVAPAEVDTTAFLAAAGSPLSLMGGGEGDGRPDPAAAQIRPTLVLGLGGLARGVLHRFRRRLAEAYGPGADGAPLRMLAVDVDRRPHWPADAGGGSAANVETVHTPLFPFDHYKTRAGEICRWLDRRWLFGIPKSNLTEGIRPLGRLALLDHGERVRTALDCALDGLARASRTAPTEPGVVRVVVLASLSGGTGGGMLVDVLHLVRDALEKRGLPTDATTALLLFGTSPKPAEKDLAKANAHATLTELRHSLQPDKGYGGAPHLGLEACAPQGSVLRDCYVVHLGDDLSPERMGAAVDGVSEYLLLDAARLSGGVLDEHRAASRRPPGEAAAEVRSFGLYRIAFRREKLARPTAEICRRRILSRWHGELNPLVDSDKDKRKWSVAYRTGWLKDVGEADAMRLYDGLALKDSTLLGRFESTAREFLKQDPESFCRETIQKAIDGSPKAAGGPSADSILAAVDDILGKGWSAAGLEEPTPAEFESAMRRGAREHGSAEAERVAQWVRETVNDPDRRVKPALAGMESLTHRLLARMELVQESLRTASAEREEARAKLSRASECGRGWLGASLRGRSSSDLGGAALEYCLARLAEIGVESVLECLKVVYRTVADLRQRLVDARREIAGAAEPLAPAPEDGDTAVDGASDCVEDLLPRWASSLADAAMALAKDLCSTSFFDDLEERINQEVLAKRGGLWSLLQEHASLDGVLEELSRTTEAAVLDSLAPVDAASLFLERRPEVGPAVGRLVECLQRARPAWTSPWASEHLVFGVPNSPSGRTLRELVAARTPAGLATAVAAPGDVVFCVESAGLDLEAVAREILGGETKLAQAGRRLLTRIDVDWPELRPTASAAAAR